MNGSDYEAISTTTTFAAGSTDAETQCLNVTITEDALVEGDETFIVTMTLLTTGVGVTTENDMSAITVMDNEGTTVNINDETPYKHHHDADHS